MSTCIYCGGVLDRGETEVTKNWRGIKITFQGVPAEICRDCGETYLEPGAVRMMEALAERARDEEEIPDVMNVAEVAKYLRVSGQTVYNMLRSGRLRAAKVGREWRFTRASVENIVRAVPTEGAHGVDFARDGSSVRDRHKDRPKDDRHE